MNKIGKKGLEYLVETLENLPSLLYLSLADCGLRDSYGRVIGDLCRHPRIQETNLSGNEFEEMSCIFIGNALSKIIVGCLNLFFNRWDLAENDSLIYLNLSWNLIRSFASIALLRAFEVRFNVFPLID